MKTINLYYLRLIGILLIILMPLNHATAQLLFGSHEFEDQLYDSHVKSLDEFIQRFNGREINQLASQNQIDKVRATRFSLFDYELLKNVDRKDSVPSIYEKFIFDVEADSIKIAIEDPHNWVEAKCDFSWKNAIKSLSLRLQLEEDDNHCWRWCIVGINGLKDCGLLDEEGVLQISPVDHELNFIGLESLFLHDSMKFAKTRKNGISIDELSYFYGLVYSGLLKYNRCDSVEFHCKQIPGYSFVVKEINRLKSSNSGWLIVSLKKLTANT